MAKERRSLRRAESDRPSIGASGSGALVSFNELLTDVLLDDSILSGEYFWLIRWFLVNGMIVNGVWQLSIINIR